MTIGKSGGRSKGNRQSAPARSTQRQREHIDPPPGASPEPMLEQPFSWTPRGRRIGQFLLWSLWVVMCCLLAVIAAAAFDVI